MCSTQGNEGGGRGRLCIVVPCHNEEASLPPFCAATSKVEQSLLGTYVEEVRYVFIDDGSSDATARVLRSMNEREPARYHYVSFSRNFGKEAALLAGLDKALRLDADFVAVMDADLQDPPELLVDMFRTMGTTECDAVAAYRRTRAGEPPIRSWFAHKFYRLINRISDVQMRDGARDFRLMRRYMVESIVALPERTRFSKGLFQWVGYTTEWVGYDNVEREQGSTSWSFSSLVRYAMEGIISFSVVPLEAISILGLVLFVLAILFLIFIIVRALIFGDPVAGWPSTVCLITLFGSLQLLGIGILGLYLSRVFTETKGRPVYVVKEER